MQAPEEVTEPRALAKLRDVTTERFLEIVSMTGNSSAAATALGMHRNTFYKRARSDPEFRARWDEAQLQSRRYIAEEVLDKAMISTGRVIEEPVLDEFGDPVLDEDFEPVVIRRLVDGDPRILSKLLDKFVASEDQAVTAIQVNNLMDASDGTAPISSTPVLVFDDDESEDDEPDRIEEALEASWEDLGDE